MRPSEPVLAPAAGARLPDANPRGEQGMSGCGLIPVDGIEPIGRNAQ